MSDSEDDVIIIDSSSPSTSASSGHLSVHGVQVRPHESNDDFGGVAGHHTPRAAASPTYSAGIAGFGAPPQSATAVDALRRHIEEKVKSLPPLRAQADTQTDQREAASAATCDSAASLHCRLREIEAAVGFHGPAPRSAAPPTAQSIVRQFVDSWHDAVGKWKRLRPNDSMGEDAGQEGIKHVKREGGSEMQLWHRLPDVSSAHPHETPAWAVGLEAALERCRDLIESPNYTIAALQQEENSALRTTFSLPSAAEASPAPLPTRPAPSAAAPAPPVAVLDSHAALLHEAEFICARERTDTLLPMYSELHALRRMRAEREQQVAHSVEEQLDWEQRRLANLLAECDAQLEVLDSNFLDSCKSRLAPIETLQQRIDSLNVFRRQLEAHAAAMLPLAPKDVATVPKHALTTTELATRAPRPTGVVGGALSQCLIEERRAWEKTVEALQAQIDEQTKRNAELRASYVHANTQLQASLDKDNYVNREVLDAAKAQHRADMEVLVAQLGWNLLNSTADVLSLRHPGTGATLHVNHAYSTINGEVCEDVSKALAAYILEHAGSTVQTAAPTAALRVGVSDPVTPITVIEGDTGRKTVALSPPPPQASHLDSAAESFGRAMLHGVSQAAEETLPAVTEDAVAQAASASRSASALDLSASAPSSRRSSPCFKDDAPAVDAPPIHSGFVSNGEGVAEVVPQSPPSPSPAAEAVAESKCEDDDANEACCRAAASSGDTFEGGDDGEDLTAYEEEGGSADAEEEDGGEGREDAEEALGGFSNLQTEEDSGNAVTPSASGDPPSADAKGSDSQATLVQPVPYESFFSASELWQNEDE
ncbi:hypothetical protein JIQ42_05194 [Leishmania sp. Namibia]|uniref:hypothetical protein n=1 Tax=Leishmania sp. Namibia TaxID=2802991 RepID=UPI001B52DB3B|nr:hypothetical protein JIQ42_05194 [Leishmania sp. Namibia]